MCLASLPLSEHWRHPSRRVVLVIFSAIWTPRLCASKCLVGWSLHFCYFNAPVKSGRSFGLVLPRFPEFPKLTAAAVVARGASEVHRTPMGATGDCGTSARRGSRPALVCLRQGEQPCTVLRRCRQDYKNADRIRIYSHVQLARFDLLPTRRRRRGRQQGDPSTLPPHPLPPPVGIAWGQAFCSMGIFAVDLKCTCSNAFHKLDEQFERCRTYDPIPFGWCSWY